MLNSEPIESEIPIEFDDLNLDAQEAFGVYHMLQDSWDMMSGTYMGKNYVGITEILELNQVEDKKSIFSLIKLIDKFRSKLVNSKKKNAP